MVWQLGVYSGVVCECVFVCGCYGDGQVGVRIRGL